MTFQKPKKLGRSFYSRSSLDVANDIIGKFIVFNSPSGKMSARVVEVEAYRQDDEACHAFNGPTPRSKPLFGQPGLAYVYLIYGMYYCFNFVTEPKGVGAAVLLRAAEPLLGIEQMSENSPNQKPNKLLAGPGKFCRSFGINLTHNGLDLTKNQLYLEERFGDDTEIRTSPRIGISKATDLEWRYFDPDSESLTRK